MSTHTETTSNWSANPWVWAVIAIPFSAVLFGIVMITAANYHPNDIVEDDYYKQGMAINQRLQKEENAKLLSARLKLLAIDQDEAIFEINAGSDTISLDLYHIRDRQRDTTVALTKISTSQYVTNDTSVLKKLGTPGIWYLSVEDHIHLWRLRKRVETPVAILLLEAS